MKTGYDSFFKKARQVQDPPANPNATFKMSSNNSEELARVAARIAKLKALKKRKMQARRSWISIKSGVIGLGLCGILGWVIYDEQSFFDTISRFEVSAITNVFASKEGEKNQGENSAGSKDGKKEESAQAKSNVKSTEVTEKKIEGTGESSQISKLNERRVELDQREKELSELEEELHKQKVEIEARIQHLESVRNQISQALKVRVEVDEEKVNRLVEFYSNMKPKQAADVITTLNEDLAVEILTKMKKKNAAEILNLLKADKAQVLTEKFAGYKVK